MAMSLHMGNIKTDPPVLKFAISKAEVTSINITIVNWSHSENVAGVSPGKKGKNWFFSLSVAQR